MICVNVLGIPTFCIFFCIWFDFDVLFAQHLFDGQTCVSMDTLLSVGRIMRFLVGLFHLIECNDATLLHLALSNELLE